MPRRLNSNKTPANGLTLIAVALLLVSCGGTAKGPDSSVLTLPEVQGQALKPGGVHIRIGGHGRPLRDTESTPVIVDDVLFIGRENGLVALDIANKYREKWFFKLPGLSSGPIVASDKKHIYLANFSGDLIKLNITDASEIWRISLPEEIVGNMLPTGRTLLVRTSSGGLYALDARSGDEKWQVALEVPSLSNRGVSLPVVYGGDVYVITDNCQLKAFRLVDGSIRWTTSVEEPTGITDLERIIDGDSDPVLIGASLYTTCVNSDLVHTNLSTKKELWRSEASSMLPISLYEDNRLLLVVEVDSALSVFDRFSGIRLWHNESLLWRNITQAAFFKDRLVVGDREGYLHVFDAESGALIGRSRPFCRVTSKNQSEEYSSKCTEVTNVWVHNDILYALDRSGRLRTFQQ